MVCTGITLVPLAVNPVIVAGFATAFQVKTVPTTFDVRVTSVVSFPEQMLCDNGALVIVGDGLTVMVYVILFPEQLEGWGPIGVIIIGISVISVRTL